MTDNHDRIERGDAIRITTASVSSERSSPHDEQIRVGLEVEYFVMFVDENGAPAGRPELATVLDALEGMGRRINVVGNPAIDLGSLGRLTFEPGAQIEHAGPPLAPGPALDAMSRVETELSDRLTAAGMRAVSLGWDPWHDPVALGQQLPGDRYRAMDRYFRARGDLGPEMMRNTCALQINLDATPDRWRAACAVSPILTATFASGPDPRLGSRRAWIWQGLDPTRTGVPSPGTDPATALCHLALGADVLLVRRPSGTDPGRPGWTFGDWIDRGDPTYGSPTETDFSYHLTTLFPEVRPRRGTLELRGIDALPSRERTAAVVLVTGAFYDDQALRHILDLMALHLDDLDTLWRCAARTGLDDPTLGTLALEVWSRAFEGARRLGTFHRDQLSAAAEYLDTYVLRSCAPGRWLAELPPTEVLAWASTTAAVTA